MTVKINELELENVKRIKAVKIVILVALVRSDKT